MISLFIVKITNEKKINIWKRTPRLLGDKYCFKIIISLLFWILEFSIKLPIIIKNGAKGFIKLGNANNVVPAISIIWFEIEYWNSSIRIICESHIKPINKSKIIKIYLK